MSRVNISCLCGKVKAVVQLRDTIPVPSIICHQSRCRWNLGALCHSALPIKDRPDDRILNHLSIFEPHNGFERHFCSICGTHLFENDHGWRIQSGVVEEIDSEQTVDALERIATHHGVHETIDGGISLCLVGSGNLPVEHPPYTTHFDKVNELQENPKSAAISTQMDKNQSRLQASCLCGGVQFYLTRPDAASIECSSPWPDLIVPYCSNASVENPDDVKWWVRENDTWMAGTCSCRSCRLGLSSPIQAWTFVPKSNLFALDGSALSYDLGHLKSFESSPGCTREFCQRCGATVFWHCTERPNVVDVSVGVLRAGEGALARNWLSWWTERVSFSEEALDKQLIGLLESNLHLLKERTL